MKQRTHNKRNTAGFTMAEALIAVLLLIIVSGVIAAGMPMARNARARAIKKKTRMSAGLAILLFKEGCHPSD